MESPYKGKTGLERVWNAFHYSLAGLRAACRHEDAFRQEVWLAAILLPFLTFYALTGYLLGNTLCVALSVLAAYGFTTIAMLIPAISEFDYALGRTTLDRG